MVLSQLFRFWHNCNSSRCRGRYSWEAWWGKGHLRQCRATTAMVDGFRHIGLLLLCKGKHDVYYFLTFIRFKYLQGAWSGSITKTEDAASIRPFWALPKSRCCSSWINRSDEIVLQNDSSTLEHRPLHCSMSHWKCTSDPSANLNIDLSIATADFPSACVANGVIMLLSKGHPRSSIRLMLVLRLLKAKQFFTLMP